VSSTGAVRPLLELREVKRRFGGVRAVDGVTLTVDEGAVVALIGPNGAGKSTLFALMMGELAPSAGEILLDGRDMQGLSPERHSRLGIGRTFQTPRLFAGLSVAENVQIALLACSGDAQGRRRLGRSDRRAPPARVGHADFAHPSNARRLHLNAAGQEASIAAALAEVGLEERSAAHAASLSQGQRKRLELAMVLALQPRVLLLDEPTAGMGVGERATIMQLVMGAVLRRGLTMVFCEHDMETVFAHAMRVVVMDRGALVADGLPQEVRRDPNVQQIYLGAQVGQGGAQ
jgi:ABC-type branched-subunit amino acid transport system ATPase component